jgi:S1-C subfamily serine protease
MNFLVILLGLIIVAADESPKLKGSTAGESIVDSGKHATALIVLSDGKTFGTAFCLHSDGYFITNEHVVQGQSECDLILEPGELKQSTHRARVIRTDAENDLALLKIDHATELTALSFDATAPSRRQTRSWRSVIRLVRHSL